MCVQILTVFPTTFNPKGQLLRFYYAQFLIIPFWLTQIFSAFLVTFISRVLYENQIATRDEIFINNFRMMGDPYVEMRSRLETMVGWSHSSLFSTNHNELSQLFQGSIQSYEVCSDIDKCLKRLTDEDDLAVATSRAHTETLPQQYKLFCFEPSQNIYDYSATFLIRHDFAWKRDVMDSLNALISSGLISKWKENLRLKKSIEITSDVRAIVISDFYSIFVMTSPIIALTVAMAFFEILIHKKINSKNVSHRWTLLDKMICGRRCFFLLKPNRSEHMTTIFTP